jgi:ferredoxin
MEKIITKQDLPEWVRKLEGYTIYAPVKRGETRSYQCIEDPAVIDLDFFDNLQSPKQVVFPQREVLLEYVETAHGNPEYGEVLPGEGAQLILGIRPCDAAALARLDKVFGGDFSDPYYLRRRKNTLLVGLGCAYPPSSACFCTSVGGAPHDKTGLDILLTDLGDSYFVESFTPRGAGLMDFRGKLFRVPKNEERQELRKVQADSIERIRREVKRVGTVSSRLGKKFDSPVWEEEAERCLRCGICTYLCPSCHCFDITDEVNAQSPMSGKRVRNWDNCQFPDFTMHSSGHNPRPGKASRLRRRVLHKFHYFVENHGDFLCTGCGRCVSKCPVGIDIVEILNKV